jgi:hypothetical protein
MHTYYIINKLCNNYNNGTMKKQRKNKKTLNEKGNFWEQIFNIFQSEKN